jgi:hypothetical protein
MEKHFTISVFSPSPGKFATVFSDISTRKLAEASLQEERDWLAALINSLQDEIWFADAAGQFTLVNSSGSREFNLNADSRTDVRGLAVKVLGGASLTSEAQSRLLDEARSAASINHPGIVGIYDAALSGHTAFVVRNWSRAVATTWPSQIDRRRPSRA